ncbi:MAG: alanine racemase [Halobacteriovoraceae bacterium]|nr:alanine racemase [Halobacteriovoraceae bacterium]
MKKRAELIINIGKLRGNFKKLKEICPENYFIPMIKANAYGHGAAEFYEVLKGEERIEGFGLASIEEALLLRKKVKCYEKPLIIFSDIFINDLNLADRYSENLLIPVISSLDSLKEFLKSKCFERVPLYLKINTGMNRLGIKNEDIEEVASLLKKFSRLQIDHLMTHFSDASIIEGDNSKTVCQHQKFKKFKLEIEAKNIQVKQTSVANSGAIEQRIGLGETHVRPGLILYGPSSLEKKCREKSIWTGEMVSSFKAHIITYYDVKKGEQIGYGSTPCPKDGTLVIMAAGYGDGLSRSLQGAQINLGPHRGEVIGKVSMDMSALVFPKLKNAKDGHDFLELWGSDNEVFLDLAEQMKKIPYELFCGLTDRVTRTYTQ